MPFMLQPPFIGAREKPPAMIMAKRNRVYSTTNATPTLEHRLLNPGTDTLTRHEQSVSKEPIRSPTTFLDLPRELRDEIYARALVYERDIQIRLPKKPNHSAKARPKETRFPCLWHAMPLLRYETLYTYYQINTIRLSLATSAQRLAFRQWIRERGQLLKGVRSVRVAHSTLGRFYQCSVSTTFYQHSPSGKVWLKFNDSLDRDTPSCMCKLEDKLEVKSYGEPNAGLCEAPEAPEGIGAIMALLWRLSVALDRSKGWSYTNLKGVHCFIYARFCVGEDLECTSYRATA